MSGVCGVPIGAHIPNAKRLRSYRVSWVHDGGMTPVKETEVFWAHNDKEALKKVPEVTFNASSFELEQFRKIKRR